MNSRRRFLSALVSIAVLGPLSHVSPRVFSREELQEIVEKAVRWAMYLTCHDPRVVFPSGSSINAKAVHEENRIVSNDFDCLYIAIDDEELDTP